MSDRTQILKFGTTTRTVSKENLKYTDLSRDVRRYLSTHGLYFDSGTAISIKKFYYNGGGKLVNYGLNAFVRDIYGIRLKEQNKIYVIYSDRFGKFYEVKDKQLAEFIFDADLCISSEGVLLFYYSYNTEKPMFYATLNCKAGTITYISSFTNLPKCCIADLFAVKGKTFIKIRDKNNDKEYYVLNFSFSLFESYGTQIYVEAFKIKGAHSDILNNRFETCGECYCKVEKAKKELSLSRTSKTFNIKEFKRNFRKSDICSTKEKVIPDDSFNSQITNNQVKAELICYKGDPGINDCINSFVYSILMVRPNIRKKIGFFKSIRYKKNVIIQADRFGDVHIHSNIPDHLFNPLFDVSLYISLEGVIVGINSYKIFISLDGIIWKTYTMADLVGEDLATVLHNSSIQFFTSDENNYLNVSEINSTDSKFKFIMNFKFNFWDLYSSPIEVYLDRV